MPYVHSTLSNTNLFHVYQSPVSKNSQEALTILRTIAIKGGAGIARKDLHTPLGVVTQVTDEELALLEKDEAFQTLLKNGFLTTTGKKEKISKVTKDMEKGDGSDPITPENDKAIKEIANFKDLKDGKITSKSGQLKSDIQ